MNEIVSSVIAFAIGGIAYIALICYSQNKRKRRTTAEIIEEMWAKMNKQDKGGKEMILTELADKLKECDFDYKSHKNDEVAAMLMVLKDEFGCNHIYQLDGDMIYPV